MKEKKKINLPKMVVVEDENSKRIFGKYYPKEIQLIDEKIIIDNVVSALEVEKIVNIIRTNFAILQEIVNEQSILRDIERRLNELELKIGGPYGK